MYVCTTDEMTVTFSSTIPVTPSLCKSIVVPYVNTNAKVTNFFPFCTIGISMYQKRILPYFIIPSTFSPQASSPLSHHRQTEGRTNFNTPCYLSSFFFSTERVGPYPQAQLYWAGQTMGWMADWTRDRSFRTSEDRSRVSTYDRVL
jgi:hypothetical protein